MNGAQSLLKTLLNNDVDICFTNPGTSEMHFVAALDEVQGMRCVLCLFEGVLSAAADGYARMARKPASTLLHLGPGLGNALANTHNAKKGNVPMVNIVGDHATYHVRHNAPLTSDIEGIAAPVSHWVHTSTSAENIARDAAEAVRQAGTHRVATLMLPADVSWEDNPNGEEGAVELAAPAAVAESQIDEAVEALRSDARCMIMIGGVEIDREKGLALSRIGKATGAAVTTDVFPPRIARGEGTATIPRLPYLAEMAIDQMKDVDRLFLIGALPPVSFFAYPNVPSAISPESCQITQLAQAGDDIDGLLESLLERLDATQVEPDIQPLVLPELCTGELDVNAVGQAIGHFLPQDAIVVDEANTSSTFTSIHTLGARSHDQLCLTGGAIGWGLPAAVGAAIACPERKVVSLEADGSAMYTLQALWTMARENLDITVVIFNNRKYSILELEFARTGARGGTPGPKAASTLSIDDPALDFVAIAQGMGVPAVRATTADDFNREFEQAMHNPGPRLIDAIVPTVF